MLPFTTGLLLFSCSCGRSLGLAGSYLLLDGIILTALLLVIQRDNGHASPVWSWLHTWLPVLSFSVFYPQMTSLDQLFFAETFDPLLRRVDLLVFARPWHQILALRTDSIVLDELAHAVYSSYYWLLFVPGIPLYRRRWMRLHEMIFGLTLMMFCHYLFFIIFPGDGPVADHEALFPTGYVFIPFMKFIYQLGGNQGGGAFPSTHVACAVMLWLYYRREFRGGLRWLIGLCCLGIIPATVYCSYHYAIDALGGLITGMIFYALGRKVYRLMPRAQREFDRYELR